MSGELFSPTANRGRVLKQGWIHKKNDKTGFMGERWQKRWFVLYENGTLEYYSQEKLTKDNFKKKLDLRGSRIKILPKTDQKKIPADTQCFEFVTPSRVYFLACEKSALDSWLTHLISGNPDVPAPPRNRSNSFFTSIIESAQKEAEANKRRLSLTSRITDSLKKTAQAVLGRSGSEQKNDDADIPAPGPSPPKMELRIDSDRDLPAPDDPLSLPAPDDEQAFRQRLKDYMTENGRLIDEIIQKLVKKYGNEPDEEEQPRSKSRSPMGTEKGAFHRLLRGGCLS